jgi:hypothetical protein
LDAAVGRCGHTPWCAPHCWPRGSRVGGRGRDTHFLRLSTPPSEHSRGEAGDITQPPGVCSEARRWPKHPGEDIERGVSGALGRDADAWARDAALARPRLPRRGWRSPGSPHGIRHAEAAPHLVLGPGRGAPTHTPGCRGQGGRQQQQQVEGAHDEPVPAACHLRKAVWAPVPGAASGHEPGNARPSPSPFSTLGSTVPASPSPPVASRGVAQAAAPPLLPQTLAKLWGGGDCPE